MFQHIAGSLLLIGLTLAGGCAQEEKYNALKLDRTEAPKEEEPGTVRDGTALILPQIASATAQAPSVDRVMIYSATLGLVVADISQTLYSIRSKAESLGGYLQEIDGSCITVRIPAARFNQALADLEKLGEVTQRHVKAQDVTEEMRDLEIRLDNAQQVRQRLAALLEKSVKMEDTLKIEAELERVTQTIELLKGKIQYYQSQVAFSAIKVELNSPLPQKQMVAQIPFQWVRDLGNGLVTGSAKPEPRRAGWFEGGTSFKLPKSYIRYYGQKDLTEAMSADGMLIKFQRQENYDGGDLQFWSVLARRALVENRAVAVEKQYDLTLRTRATARVFTGTKELAGKPQGYLLALLATKGHVYSFEAWGAKDQFAKDLPELEACIQSLDVDPWTN